MLTTWATLKSLANVSTVVVIQEKMLHGFHLKTARRQLVDWYSFQNCLNLFSLTWLKPSLSLARSFRPTYNHGFYTTDLSLVYQFSVYGFIINIKKDLAFCWDSESSLLHSSRNYLAKEKMNIHMHQFCHRFQQNEP